VFHASLTLGRAGAVCMLLLGALLALGAGGCGGGGESRGLDDAFAGPPPPDANPGLPPLVTLSPENTGDGWAVSTPAAEGMDGPTLADLMEDLRANEYPGVDSLVVVRSQRLVAEGYFNGFGRESLHDLRSTGKSFTSALAGIALEQRLVGLDDPISQHLPGFENYANVDDRKRAITLRHLLHMSTGLECNDWLPSSAGAENHMYNRRDWVKFVLDLPMIAQPGTLPAYCTGGVIVLGHILTLRSGMTLDVYAQSQLFDPLGIQHSIWRRDADGRATGGGGLRLRPRDAAKFGAVFVNEGVWNGARVIPETWVLHSRERINTLGPDGYGFLWWKRTYVHGSLPLEAVFTSGNGGNFIFTFPSHELVVVFTGSNYDSPLTQQPFDLVRRVIAALR
jgi:CubicO group peptidase (beta-lactamase class C family)